MCFLPSATYFIAAVHSTSTFTSITYYCLFSNQSSELSARPLFRCSFQVRIMEIVESNEIFKDVEGDGKNKFHHIWLLIRIDGQLHTATCPHRFPRDLQPTFDLLEDITPLNTVDRGPKMKSIWTCLDSPHDYHVKVPDWAAYTSPKAYLEEHIRNEIEICELLKLHPHPNVAVYAGCVVSNGRVSGLCFKRYTKTLTQRLNPHHTNKEYFLTMDRPLSSGDNNENVTNACLDGILAGVRHLHSLGIVHNDITPSNIMFEEDGTPVIIDFGSCKIIGESMKGVGTTYGWCDFSVKTVVETNDLNAVAELRTWLLGSSADEYLFSEG